MRVYKNLEELRQQATPRAVALGNFDGVHRGHARILAVLRKESLLKNLSPLVLTFVPHPGKITGRGAIRLLQTPSQKLSALAAAGIENVLLMPFDQSLAGMSGRDFFESVIVESLRARVIVVGEHFRFGRDRAGDVLSLESMAEDSGLSVTAVPPLLLEGRKISSTLIRRMILQGDVQSASRLLGRPYEIEGRVIHGDARGLGIGFPTANILSPNEVLPSGIFISRVLVETIWRNALTNIGTRPTFGVNPTSIETHILDFSEDLYGRDISVRLYKKNRDEILFPSAGDLAMEIARDVQAARKFFKKRVD